MINQGAGTKQNPIDFNDIDVSNLDSLCSKNDIGIFEKTKFKYIDISYWDVSNIKSTRHMFFECDELKLVGDLSDWDVSEVTNMTYMFYRCKKFNQDLSDWDVLNVRNKDNTFKHYAIKDEYKPKFK